LDRDSNTRYMSSVYLETRSSNVMKFKNYAQLDEKLILISNGKKYGQVVFLVGGAGSGKGFALSNFLEKEKFKVRDVDEWKRLLLKISMLTRDPEGWAQMQTHASFIDPEKYKPLKNLDLRKPEDVFKFHKIVDDMGIKSKTLDALLDNATGKDKGTLPNILFDMTGKSLDEFAKFMPKLLNTGYNPANIHIVWVLTNYSIALSNNLDPKRGRVVPEDILLKTHKGTSETMFDYIQSKGKKLAINGQIHVILNNRENTIFYGSTMKKERISAITGKKNDGVIKDFKYLTLKERGKPMMPAKKIQNQLYKWIVDNIPTGDLLKSLIDRGVKQSKRKPKR